jgi:hypothetical protein
MLEKESALREQEKERLEKEELARKNAELQATTKINNKNKNKKRNARCGSRTKSGGGRRRSSRTRMRRCMLSFYH